MKDSNVIFQPEGNDYITTRVEQYKAWYDKKAISMKASYLRARAIILVGGAVVPVLVNIDWPYKSLAATLISIVVVVLASLDSVFHWGEQWRNYRSTEQLLGRELCLFKYRVGPYADPDDESVFKTLVTRVESAIEQENAVTLDVLIRTSNIEKET